MDLWAIATLSAVLLLGAILTLYNSRQARALREMEQVLSDWYLMQVAERREAQRKPSRWTTRCSGWAVTPG